MTRQLTVSQMKGTGGPTGNGRPRENSRLRLIYDLLRRGETFHQKNQMDSFRVKTLVNDYGMVLDTKRGPGGYIRLIGEYEGPYFVPIERILQEDQT